MHLAEYGAAADAILEFSRDLFGGSTFKPERFQTLDTRFGPGGGGHVGSPGICKPDRLARLRPSSPFRTPSQKQADAKRRAAPDQGSFQKGMSSTRSYPSDGPSPTLEQRVSRPSASPRRFFNRISPTIRRRS